MLGAFVSNNQYFNPLHVPGCQTWLDGTNPSNNGVVPADNTLISSWKDKSKNANNATQSTMASQPTFKLNIQNGKPALFFDGNFLNGTTSITGDSFYSVFYVGKLSDNLSYYTAWGLGANEASGESVGGGFGFFGIGVPSFIVFEYGYGESDFSPGNTNSNYISSLRNANKSVSIWVNGSAETVSSGVLGDLNLSTDYTIGLLTPSSTGSYYLGYIMEIVIYNNTTSSSNRILIQNFLKNKWGL